MIDNATIESYLVRLGTPYEELEEGLWVIADDDGQIVVRHEAPIIVFRAKLADGPKDGKLALFERLLQLNAAEMITAAYGLEGDAIVVVASLQSENLDWNEFQGAVDSLTFALTAHRPELAPLLED